MDFAIGLVNSVFNLPDRQVMFFEQFEKQRNCEINSARQKAFGACWNDVWASKCQLQLAQMARCKNDFLSPWLFLLLLLLLLIWAFLVTYLFSKACCSIRNFAKYSCSSLILLVQTQCFRFLRELNVHRINQFGKWKYVSQPWLYALDSRFMNGKAGKISLTWKKMATVRYFYSPL